MNKTENIIKKTESKGSNLIQLKVSDKIKGTIQHKADDIGIPLTQYIMYLITKDIKEQSMPYLK